MAVLIYGLSDPRTGEIRYVGKTSVSLSTRMSSHLYRARDTSIRRHNETWIRSLLKIGLKPNITPLDEVPNEDWEWYETWWIIFERVSGCNLTNATTGGDGSLGLKHTEETKQKLRELNTGVLKGRPLTEEHKHRISKALIGNKNGAGNKNRLGIRLSEEHKKKIRDALKGREFSDEHRRKIGRAHQGEKSPLAVLTEKQVKEMIQLNREENTPISVIAKKYGVAYKTAWNAVSAYGESWNHLKDSKEDRE